MEGSSEVGRLPGGYSSVARNLELEHHFQCFRNRFDSLVAEQKQIILSTFGHVKEVSNPNPMCDNPVEVELTSITEALKELQTLAEKVLPGCFTILYRQFIASRELIKQRVDKLANQETEDVRKKRIHILEKCQEISVDINMSESVTPVTIAYCDKLALSYDENLKAILQREQLTEVPTVVVGFCGNDDTFWRLIANLLMLNVQCEREGNWMRDIADKIETMKGFNIPMEGGFVYNGGNRLLAWPHPFLLQSKTRESAAQLLVVAAEINDPAEKPVIETLLCAICDVVIDCRKLPWKPDLVSSLSQFFDSENGPQAERFAMPYFVFVAFDPDNDKAAAIQKVKTEITTMAGTALADYGWEDFCCFCFGTKQSGQQLLTCASQPNLDEGQKRSLKRIIENITDRLETCQGVSPKTILDKFRTDCETLTSASARNDLQRSPQSDEAPLVAACIEEEATDMVYARVYNTNARSSTYHNRTLHGGEKDSADPPLSSTEDIATIVQQMSVLSVSVDANVTSETADIKQERGKSHDAIESRNEPSTALETNKDEEHKNLPRLSVSESTRAATPNNLPPKKEESDKSTTTSVIRHVFTEKEIKGICTAILDEIASSFKHEMWDSFYSQVYTGVIGQKEPIMTALMMSPAYVNANVEQKQRAVKELSNNSELISHSNQLCEVAKTLSRFRQEMEKKFKLHRSFEKQKLKSIMKDAKSKAMEDTGVSNTESNAIMRNGFKEISGYLRKDNRRIEKEEKSIILTNFLPKLHTTYRDLMLDIMANYILPEDVINNAQATLQDSMVAEFLKLCQLKPSQSNLTQDVREQALAAISILRNQLNEENERRKEEIDTWHKSVLEETFAEYTNAMKDALPPLDVTKPILQQTHETILSDKLNQINERFSCIKYHPINKDELVSSWRENLRSKCDSVLQKMIAELAPPPSSYSKPHSARHGKRGGSRRKPARRGKGGRRGSNDVKGIEIDTVHSEEKVVNLEDNITDDDGNDAGNSALPYESTEGETDDLFHSCENYIEKNGIAYSQHTAGQLPQWTGHIVIQMSWDEIIVGYYKEGRAALVDKEHYSAFSPFFEIRDGRMFIVPAQMVPTMDRNCKNIMNTLDADVGTLVVSEDESERGMYITHFLSAIKEGVEERLSHTIGNVWFTVPLSFNTAQRRTLLRAAGAVGFEGCSILNDTVAAACFACTFCPKTLPRNSDVLIAIVKSDGLQFHVATCNYVGKRLSLPLGMGFKWAEPVFCQCFGPIKFGLGFYGWLRQATIWFASHWQVYKGNVREALQQMLDKNVGKVEHHLVVSPECEKKITPLFTSKGRSLTSQHKFAVFQGALEFPRFTSANEVEVWSVYRLQISRTDGIADFKMFEGKNVRFNELLCYKIPSEIDWYNTFVIKEIGVHDRIQYTVGELKLDLEKGLRNRTILLYCKYSKGGIFGIRQVTCSEDPTMDPANVLFTFNYAALF